MFFLFSFFVSVLFCFFMFSSVFLFCSFSSLPMSRPSCIGLGVLCGKGHQTRSKPVRSGETSDCLSIGNAGQSSTTQKRAHGLSSGRKIPAKPIRKVNIICGRSSRPERFRKSYRRWDWVSCGAQRKQGKPELVVEKSHCNWSCRCYCDFWKNLPCSSRGLALPGVRGSQVKPPTADLVQAIVNVEDSQIWKYMTGHLRKLQSPISKSYFEAMEYVKVPAFWSSVINPHQLQHALASVSEKWVNRNWADADPGTFRLSSTSLSTLPFSTHQNVSQMEQQAQLQWSVMWSASSRLWSVNPACSRTTWCGITNSSHGVWCLQWSPRQRIRHQPSTMWLEAGKWKTMNTPPYSALFKNLRNRNPMTESMHIQLHGSEFAQLPLSGNMKWLIEFPPAWSWFLSSPAASGPASSSAPSSMASAPAPGSTSVFQLPSSAPAQPLATTSKAPSMASASPAAVPQPTYDQPVSSPQVPKQSAAFVAPTSKMTSSVPAFAAPSTRLAPATLPAPLPQPPVSPWQTACIQQPVPLEQPEDFLSQDVVQQSPPEEQSTLVHAVARGVDAVQQADHIKEQTWHKQEVEKRRKTMAQPGWKTALENQQRTLPSSSSSMPSFQPPPTTVTGMTSLTTIQENQDPAPAVPARQPDPSSSSSEPTWDAWCELQESNSSYHWAHCSQRNFVSPAFGSAACPQSLLLKKERILGLERARLSLSGRVERRNEEECYMHIADT